MPGPRGVTSLSMTSDACVLDVPEDKMVGAVEWAGWEDFDHESSR